MSTIRAVRDRRYNFTMIPESFFNEMKNLSHGEMLVILMLLRHPDGMNIVDLIEKTMFTRRPIQKALTSLMQSQTVKQVKISINGKEEFHYSLICEDEVTQ